MLNLNLIGNNFIHSGNFGFSTLRKISKHISWTNNINYSGVYIDNHLNDQIRNSNVYNYGWLLESEAIRPEIYRSVKNNTKKYLDKFKYIFTFDEELLNKDDRFKFCFAGGPWVKNENKKIYEKTKLISFITSNKNRVNGHRTRLRWANKLINDVDLFGSVVGGIKINDKEVGLNDYMFSVAIENDLTNSYFTEKILDCFVTGTIPIYLGCESIGNFFDERGIIKLDNTFNIKNITKELYYEKLEYVKNNFEICLKDYNIAEDDILYKIIRDCMK